MHTITRVSLLLGLAAGCSSSPASQTITGTVEQAAFPSHVDAVQVLQGTAVVASATVAADGTFALTVPPGSGYRIALSSAGLVFPRATGTIDTSFAIAAGTQPFALGTVRYVGDATKHAHAQDGECEDGVDQNGNVCVDDPTDQGTACEDGSNDGETNDDGSTQDAAVADHNLPSSLGCDNQADGETSD